MADEQAYVLGTHDAELERLGLQHRIWRSRASDAWARAGFTPGQTLIDVGSGPGYAALDLAEIVGPAGRVIALDRSARFLDALRRRAEVRGIANVEAVECDFDVSDPPAIVADGAWSRWIYAFVKHPRRLLERMVACVRPGGVLVMHEYVDYRAWRMSPRQPAFEDFVGEVIASWRDTGGEPDIGLDLPRWLGELGCTLEDLRVHEMIARPGDFLWQWPRAFVGTGLDRLVELGRIDAARATAMRRAFDETERTPGGFCLTPTVIEILARRR